MQFPEDFPPVPKCFSHIFHAHIYNSITNDSTTEESSLLSQSLPLSLKSKSASSQELNNNCFRSLSENSQHSPCLSDCVFSPTSFQEVFSEGQVYNDHLQTKINSALIEYKSKSPRDDLKTQLSLDKIQVDNKTPLDLNNPFFKLNSSLEKLQKEMRELRQFDYSLFSQLHSLYDTMQDLKFNIGDRYSETGSEYSLGSASYMGSMSSLDEESDWGESQIFMSPFQGEESTVGDDENRQSTSSLLEQITALTQRAEED